MSDTPKVADGHQRAPRDVIADHFAGDDHPYNHADAIINRLWKAGFRVARSRYPMAGPDVPSAALFLALSFPGVDPAVTDTDELADDIAAAVNESFAHDSGRIMVSGIPAPQWLTPATLAKLRAAAS